MQKLTSCLLRKYEIVFQRYEFYAKKLKTFSVPRQFPHSPWKPGRSHLPRKPRGQWAQFIDKRNIYIYVYIYIYIYIKCYPMVPEMPMVPRFEFFNSRVLHCLCVWISQFRISTFRINEFTNSQLLILKFWVSSFGVRQSG